MIAAFEHSTASIGPVVLPLEGPLPVTTFDVLRLAPAPDRRFAEALVDAGKTEQEASRLASASGGKLSALQRLLGYVELPRWAQGLAALPLSAMLLACAFEPSNAEDGDVLEVLGADANEVELLCERLRIGPDASTLKEQGRSIRPAWRWRSPEDVWRALAGQIPAAALRGRRAHGPTGPSPASGSACSTQWTRTPSILSRSTSGCSSTKFQRGIQSAVRSKKSWRNGTAPTQIRRSTGWPSNWRRR